MRKFLFGIVGIAACAGAHAADLTVDTSDPLFIQARSGFLTKTALDYFNNGLRLGENISYGLTDRLVIGGNVHFQQEFHGDHDGFSSIDLGGLYRLGFASESTQRIIYDVLFGLKFGGSHRVRTPDYADSTYYVGLRFGRQYDGVTFAATVKSSWIFDDVPWGMAFIDFNPEIYFRVNDKWRMGGNFAVRKATNKHYDDEYIGFKVVREYGRTQYIGHVDYAFESEDVTAGLSVNVLF